MKTSVCPRCIQASAETASVQPSNGRCPVCGGVLDLAARSGPASGDARVFDEPSDSGLQLDDGTVACPVAFGPYRVLGVIGKGGMGVVYHAQHELTRDEVAIKTVRVRKRGMLHRIRREIHALARIKHPGLVRIIETDQSDGLPWYAMELLRGQSLHDRIRESRQENGTSAEADFILALDPPEDDLLLAALAEGSTATISMDEPPALSKMETIEDETPALPTRDVAVATSESPTLILLPPTVLEPAVDDLFTSPMTEQAPPEPIPEGPLRDFLALMARLCEALEYLHGEGVVHRDIKPQNVIIRPDGTPVLLDFGLASYFGAEGARAWRSWARSRGHRSTCRPSRSAGNTSTPAPISIRSAASFTRG